MGIWKQGIGLRAKTRRPFVSCWEKESDPKSAKHLKGRSGFLGPAPFSNAEAIQKKNRSEVGVEPFVDSLGGFLGDGVTLVMVVEAHQQTLIVQTADAQCFLKKGPAVIAIG